MTTSSILKKDIQTALAELGKDRDVFERVEISPEAMQRAAEKYGQVIPAALFDFWFDKHKALERRVEDFESRGQELLSSLQSFFKACVDASSKAGQQLSEAVKDCPLLTVNQIRADLDFSGPLVRIMVLVKGLWSEETGPDETALEQIHAMESHLLDEESSFIYEHLFSFAGTEIKIPMHIEAHWLLLDSRLDTDSLIRDYPISVRC
ncbi:MAG TPA: hypothetical protein VLM37_07290 [Fibrobacteraceae bacterium]|nr:hypothetical protein [Fibrobacteraceae bacterium]